MKFVTWIEAILIVALLAFAISTVSVVRKVAGDMRVNEKPQQPAFVAQSNIPEQELAVAAREESSRIHSKLVDARAMVLQREAERANADAERRLVASLDAYLQQSESRRQQLEAKLTASRTAASNAFRVASENFDRTTELITAGSAALIVLLVFATAWLFTSLPAVRNSLHVDRGIVFGGTAVVLPFVLLERVLGTAAVVGAAAIAVIVLVYVIAVATPASERRGE